MTRPASVLGLSARAWRLRLGQLRPKTMTAKMSDDWAFSQIGHHERLDPSWSLGLPSPLLVPLVIISVWSSSPTSNIPYAFQRLAPQLLSEKGEPCCIANSRNWKKQFQELGTTPFGPHSDIPTYGWNPMNHTFKNETTNEIAHMPKIAAMRLLRGR